MKLSDYVRLSLDSVDRGELEPALLWACIAVDQTGRRRGIPGVGQRFTSTIDDYAWLVEPFLGLGIDIVGSRYDWPEASGPPRSFSELVYEIFRNNLAHGSELPGGSTVTARLSHEYRSMTLSAETLELPDTIIFSLLGVAVFARVNAAERIGTAQPRLTFEGKVFSVDEWWGREDDVRPELDKWRERAPRVTMMPTPLDGEHG